MNVLSLPYTETTHQNPVTATALRDAIERTSCSISLCPAVDERNSSRKQTLTLSVASAVQQAYSSCYLKQLVNFIWIHNRVISDVTRIQCLAYRLDN